MQLERQPRRGCSLFFPSRPRRTNYYSTSYGGTAAQMIDPNQIDTVVVLRVKLHCPACVTEVKKSLLSLNGVLDVHADAKAELVAVKGRGLDPSKLQRGLKRKTSKRSQVALEQIITSDGQAHVRFHDAQLLGPAQAAAVMNMTQPQQSVVMQMQPPQQQQQHVVVQADGTHQLQYSAAAPPPPDAAAAYQPAAGMDPGAAPPPHPGAEQTVTVTQHPEPPPPHPGDPAAPPADGQQQQHQQQLAMVPVSDPAGSSAVVPYPGNMNPTGNAISTSVYRHESRPGPISESRIEIRQHIHTVIDGWPSHIPLVQPGQHGGHAGAVQPYVHHPHPRDYCYVYHPEFRYEECLSEDNPNACSVM